MKLSPTKHFCDDSGSDILPVPVKRRTSSFQTEHSVLLNWLRGLNLPLPKSLRFDVDYVLEFTTGTLLCDILTKLFGWQFPGLCRDPQTQASALCNIKWCLQQLCTLRQFPRSFSSKAREIYQGQAQTVVALLFALMHLK